MQRFTVESPDWVEKLAVGLFLCGFLAVGVYYALDNPLFGKPDEVYHYAYAIHLWAGHGLPTIDTTRLGPDVHRAMELEGHQPPLYYAIVAGLARWLGLQEKITVSGYAELAWTGWAASRVSTPNLLPVFFTGRFVSLLCGGIALLSAYLLTRVRSCSIIPLVVL